MSTLSSGSRSGSTAARLPKTLTNASAVPMLPVLKVLKLGRDGRAHFCGSPFIAVGKSDLEAVLPSGRQSTFNNRVAWALGYLKQPKLLESPRRSVYRITARGEDVLKAPPPRIDIAYLDRYSEFVAFRSATGPSKLKSLDPGLQKTMTEGIPASVDGQYCPFGQVSA